jgi:baculoviral IAP repeat-containing protein 2/3
METGQQSLNMFVFVFFFFNKDDLMLIRKNRMALFQHLTCVVPILESLLTASVIDEQECDIIKQKTRASLQSRKLIDIILIKGNIAATIFKNSLKETDPMLYNRLFGEY